MALVALRCPHCGADIQFEENRESGFCTYCGSKIVNDNVKTMKLDNSAQFTGALGGAYNALMADDLDVATNLIDEALKHNGNSSDALFVKSAIMMRTEDYAKAATYYNLAKNNASSSGIVSEAQYRQILVAYMDSLKKESLKYVMTVLSRDNYESEDMDNCRIYVTKKMYLRIDDEFPLLSGMIKEETQKRFAEIEPILNVPNEISQQNWDAMRAFDKVLLEAVVLFFADASLQSRYVALIKSYGARLNLKWTPLLQRSPDYVDRKELASMKGHANCFINWIR